VNSLKVPRAFSLGLISTLIIAAAVASFAESYRALVIWALSHGLHGLWAAIFPLQVDSFIGVGELALFVALADQWNARSRAGAWLVTAIGLGVSIAANVGHVTGHDVASRFTAAVPPLAASAALAVGLGVLKRVVASRAAAVPEDAPVSVSAEVVKRAPAKPKSTPKSRAPEHVFARELEAGNIPSLRTIKSTMKVGTNRAREHREQLLALVGGEA
jgi:hypothetical protein